MGGRPVRAIGRGFRRADTFFICGRRRAPRRATALGLIGLVSLLGLADLTGSVLTASPAAADAVGQEWAFVRLINSARAQQGLAPLVVSSSLRQVAAAQSGRMADQDRLFHNPNLQGDIASVAPDWQRLGENVGRGGDVASLQQAFMGSPEHRDNVLGSYNAIGVAVAQVGHTVWVTEDFVLEPSVRDPIPPPSTVGITRLAPGPGAAGPGSTSRAVSAAFPSGASRAVVVARADAFPDALAGGPLAAAYGGPMLLVDPNGDPGPAVREARRVLVSGAPVIVLGGPDALPPSVEAAFRDGGLAVERLAGADRYQTAVAIAGRIAPHPVRVLVASGTNYPDALSLGPVAALEGDPIVLTDPAQVPDSTSAYLQSEPNALRTVAGGPAAVSDAVVSQLSASERIAGPDRYATSARIADRWFGGGGAVTFASGENFTDPLAGIPWSAHLKAPLLLTPSTPAAQLLSYVAGLAAPPGQAVAFGSTTALPDAVVATYLL